MAHGRPVRSAYLMADLPEGASVPYMPMAHRFSVVRVLLCCSLIHDDQPNHACEYSAREHPHLCIQYCWRVARRGACSGMCTCIHCIMNLSRARVGRSLLVVHLAVNNKMPRSCWAMYSNPRALSAERIFRRRLKNETKWKVLPWKSCLKIRYARNVEGTKEGKGMQ